MADNPSAEQKIKANMAKATDSAADDGASIAAHGASPPGASKQKGKFLPKNKHRLPRREKKAQKKTAGRL